MDRLLMKKLEMVARVAEFQRAHPYTDRNQAAVGRRFEERIAAAQSLFAREQGEREAHDTEKQHRRALRNEIAAIGRSVVRIGRLAAGGDARLASRFKSVTSGSNAAFFEQSRALLEVANENQEALIGTGLLAPQLAAFASRLAEFQEVLAAIVELRRKRNETRSALRTAMRDLGRLVRVLDVFQAARFADDPSLREAWDALRVVGTLATRGEIEVDSEDAGAEPVLPLAPGVDDHDPLPGDGGRSKAA